MIGRRSVVKLLDAVALAPTTTTIALASPAWARRALVTVAQTASVGGTPTLDCKVVQRNPDISGTAIDVTNGAIDQINTTSAAQRFLAWGNPATLAGTNIDVVASPVTKYQALVIVNAAATSATFKVWVEYTDA